MSMAVVLCGMLVEIVGALLLAIDAIGVGRVKAWASGPMVVVRYLARDVERRGIGGIIAYVIGACAWVVGAYAASQSGWLTSKIGFAPGAWGFLVGLTAAVLTVEFARIVLLAITTMLLAASDMAHRRTAGIAGAGLLMFGFSLQFAGTVAQALK